MKWNWMAACLVATALAGCAHHPAHTMPDGFPTLSETKTGIPMGADVYVVVKYMNSLKDAGRIDNFHCWEGGEYFEAWKTTGTPPETWVVSVDLRGGGVVKDVKLGEQKSPPTRPAATK